jgi:glycosyltransferase involved in cell wall biosynthesis
MLISIIIPVFNEENFIKEILIRVNKLQALKKEIIVINDCSTDNTLRILEKECKNLYTKLISNQKNMGKGFSVREGFKYVTGEIIIIQDADLEYNPENYPALINPIINQEAEVVYGSRVIEGGIRTRPKIYDSKIRLFANNLLTYLSNFLNNQNLTDCHTCYKVFSKKVIKKLNLKEDGFAFCPEVTAKISREGIKIKEVPIDYFGRTHAEGKKIIFFDGIKAVFAIIKYNLFKKT